MTSPFDLSVKRPSIFAKDPVFNGVRTRLAENTMQAVKDGRISGTLPWLQKEEKPLEAYSRARPKGKK